MQGRVNEGVRRAKVLGSVVRRQESVDIFALLLNIAHIYIRVEEPAADLGVAVYEQVGFGHYRSDRHGYKPLLRWTKPGEVRADRSEQCRILLPVAELILWISHAGNAAWVDHENQSVCRMDE